MSKTSTEREDKLLGAMLAYEMRNKPTVSFRQLSKDLNFMERTKTWRDAWEALMQEKNFIEIAKSGGSMYTGPCQLTAKGKEYAATPEYLEYQKELNFVPQDNEAHQASLKKRFTNNHARSIFDLLLKHGSLSRKELATLLRCNDRSHGFSYGLKDLKGREIVEADESSSMKGALRLSDKAFMDPSDRPEEATAVEPKLLEEAQEAIQSKKKKKKMIPTSEDEGEVSTKKKKKAKTSDASDAETAESSAASEEDGTE
mmetsp:Transcript_14135/g.30819  ORF Transcript_14135/g.30819 Transcript_14135/m.30819 type:complete len:257 (-) Transcript_14135:14-784(-)